MSTENKNLNIEHPDYIANKNQWRLVRDLIKGERALKDYDLSNIKQYALNTSITYNIKNDLIYLPYTSTEYTDNDLRRYATYVQRAALFNVTRRTEAGMTGMIYNKASTIELPLDIEYLNTDADGTGVGIGDQSVEVVNDVLEVGRCGLFVDYPVNYSELSLEEVNQLEIRANIIKYKAEDIVDWACESYGASQKLAFVKLRETYTCRNPENMFELITQCRYRVLRINEFGEYEVNLYYADDSYETYIPVDNMGQPFTFIPFYFIGSIDNRPDCDIAPLLEIAELNIKHYRNSADYEESCFLVGQPMVGIIGLSQGWVDDNYPDGILFGSRQCLMLPPGGDVKIVQADANTMALKGMQEKENQMKMLGARLITDGGGVETAAAARIKHAADGSVLKVVVKNVNQGYNDAILAAQLYNGSIGDFEFEINDDFFVNQLDASKVSSVVQLWQNGLIDVPAVLDELEKMGVNVESSETQVNVESTDEIDEA